MSNSFPTLSSNLSRSSRFACVEITVGGANEVGGVGHAVAVGGDADAGADAVPGEEGIVGDGASDAGGVGEAAAAVGVCEDGNELIAAVASGEVHGASLFDEDAGEGAQHIVTGLVAGAIVVGLEIVEIEEHDGEAAAALGGGEFLLEEELEGTAIGQ